MFQWLKNLFVKRLNDDEIEGLIRAFTANNMSKFQMRQCMREGGCCEADINKLIETLEKK